LGGSGSQPVTTTTTTIIIIPVMADHVTPMIKLRRKIWRGGGTCRGGEKYMQSFWCRNLKASVLLEDLDIGGKII